jgi:two-component system, OmpR family, sensor histidine kinase MprB
VTRWPRPRGGRGAWLRRRLAHRPLLLRTRFTLVAAGAVAAATLAVTAVAFIVVRSDLRNQVSTTLEQRAVAVVHQAWRRYHGHIPVGWVPRQSDQFGAASTYLQVVTASGSTWTRPGDRAQLPAGATAVAVAAGRHAAYYSDATVDGVRAMVLTMPLDRGLALQIATPLATVDAELGAIGAALALLSAFGVAAAALVGWAVARAGLAPVGRLARVAEEVTATGYPRGRVTAGRPDELGRLAASFNQMLKALRRSHAAQRQLVSDASHELRTPLTSLRINAELLAADDGLAEADRKEILGRIVAQAAELGQLVTDITELAGDQGRAGPFEEVKLHEVVAAELDAARRDWPRCRFRSELDPCLVPGRVEHLRRAVRNLLDNAAKFGPPDGPVDVRLAAGELTVRDHGPGIATADRDQVFKRFSRAPQARGTPGSGLGLAIVRQAAEAHGGTVTAEAPPGGGALLRLRLPARLGGGATLSGNLRIADERHRVGTKRDRDPVAAQDPRHLVGDPLVTGRGGMQAVT